MRKILLVLTMGLFAFNLSAQSVNELKGKSKTTKKEKEDAARARTYTSTYGGKSHRRGMDWDVDDDTWGIAYSYSPHFPLTLSANWTWSYFQIGGELGFNLSGKRYDWDTNATAQPIGYFMAQPGFYCKFFSVQCGVGALFDIRRETSEEPGETTIITQINGQSNTSVSQSSYSVEQTRCGVNLCIKPSITGFIPISDGDYYITINAGYIFVPKLKDLNGFTVGVGFQITID